MNNTPRIRPFKPQLQHFTSLDSTNTELKRRLNAGKAVHGEAVIADFQTSGRGQAGNVWAGNAGENLYMSLFAELSLPAEEQFRLTILVSLAVCDVLANHGIRPVIKWPNDIYCGKKKVSGILIENQLQGSFIRNTIIGVGINLNQETFDGLESATSLLQLTGSRIQPGFLAAELLEQLQWRLLSLNEQADLLPEYYKHLMFFSEKTRFEADSRIFEATVRGIDAWGKLVLEENGSSSYYSLKEIKWMDL